MSDKDFGELAEKETDAFVDHMTGVYSQKKREVWIDARDECADEFWRLTSAAHHGDNSE